MYILVHKCLKILILEFTKRHMPKHTEMFYVYNLMYYEHFLVLVKQFKHIRQDKLLKMYLLERKKIIETKEETTCQVDGWVNMC